LNGKNLGYFGRVAVSADPMSFQPYRIWEAGNARLLRNIFVWLLREPVAASSDLAEFAKP
jgi:hypothetical protein